MCATEVVIFIMVEFLEAMGTNAEIRLNAPLTLISKHVHQFSGPEVATERRSGTCPALAIDLMGWKVVERVLCL